MRVAIHEKDFEPLKREACSEVDGGGGFAHSTFLVDDADYLTHGIQD